MSGRRMKEQIGSFLSMNSEHIGIKKVLYTRLIQVNCNCNCN